MSVNESKILFTESPYPEPILDWAQTRKVNGKIISNLRQQVNQRLLAEQGDEYKQIANDLTD